MIVSPDVFEPVPETPPNLFATLTASPSGCYPGDPIQVGWSAAGADPPHSTDWIGLYPTGAENTAYVQYKMTQGQASGRLTFNAPDQPGTYEFRYLFKNGYDSVSQRAYVTLPGKLWLVARALPAWFSTARDAQTPGPADAALRPLVRAVGLPT